MIVFYFYKGRTVEEKMETDEKIKWIAASEVLINSEELCSNYESVEYDEKKYLPNISLKLVKTDKVVTKLKVENCKTVIEAESQHSDLITAKYEGQTDSS